MISTAGTNFLRHIFSESVPDLANIMEAQATDDKEALIDYLTSIKNCIERWITQIKELEDKL